MANNTQLIKLQQQYNGTVHQNGILQNQLNNLQSEYSIYENKYLSGNITQSELGKYKQIVNRIRSLSSQINSNNQKLQTIQFKMNQEQQKIMMRASGFRPQRY